MDLPGYAEICAEAWQDWIEDTQIKKMLVIDQSSKVATFNGKPNFKMLHSVYFSRHLTEIVPQVAFILPFKP